MKATANSNNNNMSTNNHHCGYHESDIKRDITSLLAVDANSLSSYYLRQMIVALQNTSKNLQGLDQDRDCNSTSKRRRREMKKIANHLNAGLHDHGSAPTDVAMILSSNRQRLAKRSSMMERFVVSRQWNDDGTKSKSHGYTVPIHYYNGTVPQEVLNICTKLKVELLDLDERKAKGRALICSTD